MRCVLTVSALALGVPATVHADGEIQVRGAYYKEDATRVTQPMIDTRFDVGEDAEVTAHALVDTITSASVAAGAAGEPFTELRYEGGAGYLHRIGNFLLGGFGRYSYEPDYQSIFAGLNGRANLARDNTTIDLALSVGHDEISNAGAQSDIQPDLIEGQLDTLLASIGITQVLSERVIGGITYDLIRLAGFLENPYRMPIVGGQLRREAVPETRLRHAVAGTARGYLPETSSTVIARYRLYVDDWGIVAHTPEAQWVQELGEQMSVRLRYRYYRQSAADFYRDIYDDPDTELRTDDPKLSAFTTQKVGVVFDSALARLGFDGEVGRWRGELRIEYVSQTNRYGDAFASQLALTVPFEY